MPRHPQSTFLGKKRPSLRAWQDRIRDPILTVLFVMQLLLMFVALPLDASGVPLAAPIGQSALLLVLTFVVLLSHRVVAIVLILLGLGATLASVAVGHEWSPIAAAVLNRGGVMLVFSALTWVIVHSVYAPGRITFHRIQGAIVVYLSLATIFAAAFTMLWEVVPDAFANVPNLPQGPREIATMLYFSLATLTTTGYGDIVPRDAFARSLANLEAVVGQFYLAITVARLVTMELADRRR